ncbi:hypothetical protein MBLNU457_g0841t1 [Dothideomycetes sp. NU457]
MSSPWLQRDSLALKTYSYFILSTNGIGEVVIFSFLIYNIVSSRKVLRSPESAALRSGQPLSKEQITAHHARLNEALKTEVSRMNLVLRSLFKLAAFNMVNVSIMTLIDSYLCITDLCAAIADANTASPTGWDIEYISQITWLVLKDFTLFFGAFLVVPALQALLAIYILNKLTTGLDGRPLSHYASVVTTVSVLLAFLWSLVCLGLSFSWPPMTDSIILRFVCLESAWGSALLWLHASILFVYRADKLVDMEIFVAETGFGSLVKGVGETVGAAYVREEKKPLLPVVEKA